MRKELSGKETVIKEYLALTIGSVFAASGIYFFMIPGNIIMGSVAGLAMILVHFVPVSVSVMTFLLNILCLILGRLFVGKGFTTKTIYVSVLIPAIMRIYEVAFPDITSITENLLLDIICLIIMVSIGQAIIFQANASSGGLDIIAKILNKYLHWEFGQAILITGSLIIFSSIFVYDMKTLIVGVVTTYFNGMAVDKYISGFTRKKKVCVISDKYREIQRFISSEIVRGVTLYPARGGYSNKEYMELVTILDKNEYGKLMNYIQTVDAHAFITVSSVSEVVGLWKQGKMR